MKSVQVDEMPRNKTPGNGTPSFSARKGGGRSRQLPHSIVPDHPDIESLEQERRALRSVRNSGPQSRWTRLSPKARWSQAKQRRKLARQMEREEASSTQEKSTVRSQTPRLRVAWQVKATALEIDWLRFREDVRRCRTELGLSVRQFAVLTGINYSKISRIESGAGQLGCNAEIFLSLTQTIGKSPLLYTRKRRERLASWVIRDQK